MRFSRSGSMALFVCLLGSGMASRPAGQTSVALHRGNELTLAGLRPGKDTISRAKSKYENPEVGKLSDTSFSWIDVCRKQLLSLQTEPRGKIVTVRVAFFDNLADCKKMSPSKWRTGRGLAIYDSTAQVIQLYGQPDSRGPSTKGGQQLELLHYAFDWAGPDVPQVMEVLCTPEKDETRGRVLEITLAVTNF